MKVEELQIAADRNNMKGVYSGLKEVCGPQKNGPVHLKSTDGMETFSDSKRVVARWSEHFQIYSFELCPRVVLVQTFRQNFYFPFSYIFSMITLITYVFRTHEIEINEYYLLEVKSR